MNVYDFDETIYRGDSTRDFYFYCLKRKPSVIKWIFYQGFYAVFFALGIMKKTDFKEKFYSFFKSIDNIDEYVNDFWKCHEKNIKQWYLDYKRDDDVIISASPEFLLAPICKKLGIKYLIASRVNKNNGSYTGLNCYGDEKVIRYREKFGNEPIDEFYSDSYSDSPLAEIAGKSYIVKDNELIEWNS